MSAQEGDAEMKLEVISIQEGNAEIGYPSTSG
jgi:hypothetical protein